MRHRKQIYYYDLARIEQGTAPLSPAEQDVKERLGRADSESLVTRLDLAAALQVLTEKQHACFLLFADGHTEREIAAALHISQPAVHHLLTKARARLKKILQGGYQSA